MSAVRGALEGAAAVPFAMAVAVMTVALVRAGPAGRAGVGGLAAGLALGLEFLLAAGLLRLSGLGDFEALAAVAAVVLVRRLVGIGLRLGVRALRPARPPGVDA